MRRQAALKVEEKVLIPQCDMATDVFTRFMGLMGKSGIAEDRAIIFPRCNSIHTFFMRFPIDVVFVDAKGIVLEVVPALKSWRLLMPRWKASYIIEMKADRAKVLGIRPGTKLEVEVKR